MLTCLKFTSFRIFPSLISESCHLSSRRSPLNSLTPFVALLPQRTVDVVTWPLTFATDTFSWAQVDFFKIELAFLNSP